MCDYRVPYVSAAALAAREVAAQMQRSAPRVAAEVAAARSSAPRRRRSSDRRLAFSLGRAECNDGDKFLASLARSAPFGGCINFVCDWNVRRAGARGQRGARRSPWARRRQGPRPACVLLALSVECSLPGGLAGWLCFTSSS